VHVAFAGEPRYVFPAGDCVILPIPNTTVEMLAQYLAGRVRADLGSVHLKTIEVAVEENFGQSASYRETLDD
jgi:6-pyruvoyltetrahydropterin/6-carboxytetrahydropterin synthase